MFEYTFVHDNLTYVFCPLPEPDGCQILTSWRFAADEGQQILSSYLLPPILVVGIVCNILTIVVLSRDDTMIQTTSLLLRMLATADLLNVTALLLTTSIPYKQTTSIYVYFNKDFFIPLQSIVFTASAWFEVLISAERYIAVCYPLHIDQFATVPRVRAAILVVWLFALVFNVPRFLESNALHSSLMIAKYEIAYLVVLRSVFNTFLPFCSLAVFTSRVITTLRKSIQTDFTLSNCTEEKMKKLSRRLRRTTVTSVLIVVIFIIFDLPVQIEFGMKLTTSPLIAAGDIFISTVRRDIEQLTNALASISMAIKSTLNFFVFCLTGAKYRKIVIDACHCRATRNS